MYISECSLNIKPSRNSRSRSFHGLGVDSSVLLQIKFSSRSLLYKAQRELTTPGNSANRVTIVRQRERESESCGSHLNLNPRTNKQVQQFDIAAELAT